MRIHDLPEVNIKNIEAVSDEEITQAVQQVLQKVKTAVNAKKTAQKRFLSTDKQEGIITDALKSLQQGASKGYALCALGFIKAAVISGQGIERIPEYVTGFYKDFRGAEQVKAYCNLAYLIQKMQENDTLSLASPHSAVGFAFALPKNRFHPDLYEVMQEKTETKNPFFHELFSIVNTEACHVPTNVFEQSVQLRAYNCLSVSAKKKYPDAITFMISLLEKEGQAEKAQEYKELLKRAPYTQNQGTATNPNMRSAGRDDR